MAIKYVLHPNPLTHDPDDHRAMIHHGDRYTMEDVIDRMISRGSTVTKADALSVIEEYEAAITELIAEGGRIHTPLFRINLSLAGTFDGPTDRFEPGRHRLNLNFKPGPRVEELHEQITLEKVTGSKRRPVLRTFTDVTTETTNEKLTPGGVGTIRGNWLKTNPGDPDQGLFIIGSDGSEVRVDEIIRNMPKELIVMVPETLPPAPLDVELRTRIRHSNGLRAGRLDHALQPA